MKKRSLFLFLLLCLVSALTACKKYHGLSDDLKGLLYIHGRLYTVDTISTTGKVLPMPLGGATVQIGYAKDSAVNYLYSVKADSNGYFTFTNLSPDSSYVVFCKSTVDSVIFYRQRPYKMTASIDTTILALYPSQTWQNGLVFDVTDNSSKPQPIGGCQVCLFQSKQLFLTDTCASASYVLKTNAYGAAVKLDVPAGHYYALFTDVAYSKLTLSGKDSIDVSVTGITRKTTVIK